MGLISHTSSFFILLRTKNTALILIRILACLISVLFSLNSTATRLPNIHSDDTSPLLNSSSSEQNSEQPSKTNQNSSNSPDSIQKTLDSLNKQTTPTIKKVNNKSSIKPIPILPINPSIKNISRQTNRTNSTNTVLPVLNQPKKKINNLSAIPNSKAINDQWINELYETITTGQATLALNKINQMLNLTPNYKLLHMIKADLLVMMSQKNTLNTNKGKIPILPTLTAEQNKRFQDLHKEVRLRIKSRKQLTQLIHTPLLPKYLLKLADNEPYAIVVDGQASRLYLYQNQPQTFPKLIRDFYITQGKLGMNKIKEGDNKTPVGVYFTPGRMSDKLSDFYGSGALPLDYPNLLDKFLNRTGHGIWLHGSPPDTYARSPYASEGCVVLSNPDIETLLRLPITNNLPVIITNAIEWVDTNTLKNTQETAWSLLKQWNQLPKNNAISIHLNTVSMFEYPNQSNVFLITFNYTKSNTIETKQLYWKKSNTDWQLILEN